MFAKAGGFPHFQNRASLPTQWGGVVGARSAVSLAYHPPAAPAWYFGRRPEFFLAFFFVFFWYWVCVKVYLKKACTCERAW